MILVPADTPGVDIVRDVPTMEHPFPHYRDASAATPRSSTATSGCRPTTWSGNEGDGFRLAQMRLGPGRIHHCMRWLGQSQRAFDMLCERAVSRYLHGSLLADKQIRPGLGGRLHGRDDRGPAHDAARGLEDGPRRRPRRPGSRSP